MVIDTRSRSVTSEPPRFQWRVPPQAHAEPGLSGTRWESTPSEGAQKNTRKAFVGGALSKTIVEGTKIPAAIPQIVPQITAKGKGSSTRRQANPAQGFLVPLPFSFLVLVPVSVSILMHEKAFLIVDHEHQGGQWIQKPTTSTCRFGLSFKRKKAMARYRASCQKALKRKNNFHEQVFDVEILPSIGLIRRFRLACRILHISHRFQMRGLCRHPLCDDSARRG